MTYCKHPLARDFLQISLASTIEVTESTDNMLQLIVNLKGRPPGLWRQRFGIDHQELQSLARKWHKSQYQIGNLYQPGSLNSLYQQRSQVDTKQWNQNGYELCEKFKALLHWWICHFFMTNIHSLRQQPMLIGCVYFQASGARSTCLLKTDTAYKHRLLKQGRI